MSSYKYIRQYNYSIDVLATRGLWDLLICWRTGDIYIGVHIVVP